MTKKDIKDLEDSNKWCKILGLPLITFAELKRYEQLMKLSWGFAYTPNGVKYLTKEVTMTKEEQLQKLDAMAKLRSEKAIKKVEERKMQREDKDLLLRDLCARLPYKVMCQMKDEMRFVGEKSPYYDYILSERHIELFRRHKSFYIKPYLRPMSSMTEEEMKEFVKFHCVNICPIVITEKLTISNESEMFDWLNKKMFDYRGLIDKGLAISTEEFNPYKD